MSFQLTTSLFGHAGIERDLTSCNDEELASFAAWAAMYREFRPLLHTGTVVRADLEDEQTLLHGVVAADQSSALFCWARLATSAAGQSGRVRLPGLDAQRSYRLRIRPDLGLPATHEVAPPAWLNAATQDWLTLPGAVLVTAGLPMPTLNPAQALLIEIAPVATA
jgi:alpha-galactosidase